MSQSPRCLQIKRKIVRFCFHAPSDELRYKKFLMLISMLLLIGKWRYLQPCLFYSFPFPSVAEGVTAINQAIDAQDERLLRAALTYPRASIYGVTSKCIQEYLEELKKLKDSKKDSGQ